MTQAQLKKKIKNLQQVLKGIDAVKRSDKKLEAAWKKVREIEKDYDDRSSVILNEIEECKQQIQQLKKEKDFKVSEKLQEWFRGYKSGMDWGYGGIKIVWVSEDERFVILTNKGGIAGTGTAMGTGGYYYSRTEHFIVDTQAVERPYVHRRDNESIGNLGDICEVRVEGRLTKEKRETLFLYLAKYKKEQGIK